MSDDEEGGARNCLERLKSTTALIWEPNLSPAFPRGTGMDWEVLWALLPTHLPLAALHDDQLLLGGRPGKDDLLVAG